MLVIIDTSVIISYFAAKKERKTYVKEFMQAAILKKIELAVCDKIISELKRVIKSDQIKKLSHYNPRLAAKFIAWYKYNN